MRPIFMFAALAAVALFGVAQLGKSDQVLAAEQRGTTEVADSVDLVEVKTDDSSVTVFVNRSGIEEHSVDGITFRTVHVVYHLSSPMIVRGEAVHYILGDVAYQCGHGLYLTTRTLLLGKDADPLFKYDGIGEVEEVKEKSNSWYVMKYVCGAKTKKTPKSTPKSDKKYIDI